MTAARRLGVGTPAVFEGIDEAASPTAALLAQAIDFALDSLNRLERQAGHVARRVRTSTREAADDALRELLNTTQTLMKLGTLTASVGGLDFDELCQAQGTNPEAETTAAMNELVWHQMSDNRFAVAATLDRAYVLALEAWRRIFVAMGARPTDPCGHAA